MLLLLQSVKPIFFNRKSTKMKKKTNSKENTSEIRILSWNPGVPASWFFWSDTAEKIRASPDLFGRFGKLSLSLVQIILQIYHQINETKWRQNLHHWLLFLGSDTKWHYKWITSIKCTPIQLHNNYINLNKTRMYLNSLKVNQILIEY